MDILLGLLFWALIGAGVKTAWDHARTERQRSRQASVTKAQKKASPKDLTAGQRRVTTARHDVGWWASEALRGFPVHRTGWSHGWVEHKTELVRRRDEREQARATHAEARADVAEAMPGHRERQEAARQRIEKAQQPPQETQPGEAPPLPAETISPVPAPLAPLQEPAWASPPPDEAEGSTKAVDGTAPSPAPEGERPVATETETSYEEVVTAAQQQAVQADSDIADLDQRIAAARALADAMVASEVDSASVSDQMDYIDKLVEAREALSIAGEQSGVVETNVTQRHGGVKEAVDDSSVEPAAMGFYQGG